MVRGPPTEAGPENERLTAERADASCARDGDTRPETARRETILQGDQAGDHLVTAMTRGTGEETEEETGLTTPEIAEATILVTEEGAGATPETEDTESLREFLDHTAETGLTHKTQETEKSILTIESIRDPEAKEDSLLVKIGERTTNLELRLVIREVGTDTPKALSTAKTEGHRTMTNTIKLIQKTLLTAEM